MPRIGRLLTPSGQENLRIQGGMWSGDAATGAILRGNTVALHDMLRIA
jgi:hypothetical protein